MSTPVFLTILVAAAMHAGWNVIVKTGLDGLLGISLVAISAGVLSLPLLPFVSAPVPAAWPWLLASVALHIGYNIFLVRAYRFGDLGQVYPIARGTAPLITALAGMLVIGEHLGPVTLLGIAILCGGVWVLSLGSAPRSGSLRQSAVAMALLTSLFIAGYSLTDGMGARANGSAHSYAIWLFALDGIGMVGLLLLLRGPEGFSIFRLWGRGLGGGAMSFGAYWIVIWAMTRAPIALVAALRESSVLFAALFSVLLLRERPRLSRGAAAVLIASGVALVRLG